jgi:formyltetrahydrofolate-dependent phosphoribosylglycinamide formyltransferase
MSEAEHGAAIRAGIRIAVMVSGHGRGSNLQALMDACENGRIHGTIEVVIGTKDGAPALERAARAGVPWVVIRPGRAENADRYARALRDVLTERRIDLVCLAGYMRLLPPALVAEYRGRIMNIHPALLPAYGGRGMYGEAVHRAVIESGAQVSGCTVHFVDEQYDHGPIILQTQVPVHKGDTPETLAARILPEEHRTYVEAVRLFAEGRLRLNGNVVEILGEQ